MNSKLLNSFFFLYTFVISIYVIFGTFSNSGLFWDGSYGIISLLIKQDFFNMELGRGFSGIIIRVFIFIAIKLNITDISIMVKIYSFSMAINCVFPWLIASIFCYNKKNIEFLIYTIILSCSTFILSGFFMCIESISGLGVFWSLFVYYWFYKNNDNIIYEIIFGLLVFYCIKIHESFAFLGLLLFSILTFRIIKKDIKINFFLLYSKVMLVISIIIGYINIINPRDQGNAIGALNSMFKLHPILIVVMILLFISFLLVPYKDKNKIIIKIINCIQCLIGLIYLYLVIFQTDNIAANSYNYRIINILLIFGFTFVLSIILIKNKVYSNNIFQYCALFILLSTLIFSIVPRIKYNNYLKDIDYICSVNDGFLPIINTDLSNSLYWSHWTLPIESVLAQAIYSDGVIHSAIINTSNIGWEPFNSRDISKYPDLSGYNVNYIINSFNDNILSKELSFMESNPTAKLYTVSGFSKSEETHTWTDGNNAKMLFKFNDNIDDDLIISLNIKYIFNGSQRLITKVKNNVVYDQVLSEIQTININIPKELINLNILEIDFEFPDAVSPLTTGESADVRNLAFAFTTMVINDYQ